jgi:hypothetical protein
MSLHPLQQQTTKYDLLFYLEHLMDLTNDLLDILEFQKELGEPIHCEMTVKEMKSVIQTLMIECTVPFCLSSE